MKAGELVEGSTFRTRLTGRAGTVTQIHPVSGVCVTWVDGGWKFIHPDVEVDPVGFVRPEDKV